MESRSILLALLCIISLLRHEAAAAAAPGSKTFSVIDYGAKANPSSDDTKAFQDAWHAACDSSGEVKLRVPKGTYYISQIQFAGPCRSVTSFVFQLEGTLKGSTDLNQYADHQGWVEFAWINKLTLTGGGTFDGQGALAWPFNKCPETLNCKILPTSIKFITMNDTIVQDITSLNPKFFHMAILACSNFRASSLTITSPGDSPNTDGIHIETSTDVIISSSKIAAGDDCISIGHGNTGIQISNINCGPGHGISIGSLGRYKYEKDVSGITVRDCTFTGTMTGVRIKTWENGPVSLKASDMDFENLIMQDVGNPILIDQTYCPFATCDKSVASRVKLMNIRFSDIRGTASMPEAVTLECSQGAPCQNISLNNIKLHTTNGNQAKIVCVGADAKFTGTMIPPPCSQ